MKLEINISNNDDKVVLENESLLDACRKKGINIRSSCGGHATCSDCVVIVKSGEKNMTDVNFSEKKLLGNVYYITKERLACQIYAAPSGEDGGSTVEIVNLDG